MQKEITESAEILDEHGQILTPGWAKTNLFHYDRSKVAVNAFRIKEWDFWEVINPEFRFVVNIFDIGLFGLGGVVFTDFKTKTAKKDGMLKLCTRGSVNLPNSVDYEQPLIFTRGSSRMEFSKQGDYFQFKIEFPSFQKGEGLKAEFSLFKDPKQDSMVNVIPFENPKQFVYAHKMVALPAKGYLQIGKKQYEISKANQSFGVLDWTRAVFPHKTHWKWGTFSGIYQNAIVGINLDYGFGTESSKNMFFYNGKGHHLDEISYTVDWQHPMSTIQISSNDNRVHLTLSPEYTENDHLSLGLMGTKGISIYGYFTGEILLDDSTKIEITRENQIWGWVEEFYQTW